MCVSHCLCLALHLSLSVWFSLSLSLTILPSLYHPLTISLTHYCCLLHLSHSSSLCLSLSYHLLPFPFTMSLPLTPLLFLSLPLSSIFPITVCILNTLVAEEKSLRFHWTNMARRHYPLRVTIREGGMGWRETPECGYGRATWVRSMCLWRLRPVSASKRVEPLCSIFADVSVRSGLSYLGVEDGGTRKWEYETVSGHRWLQISEKRCWSLLSSNCLLTEPSDLLGLSNTSYELLWLWILQSGPTLSIISFSSEILSLHTL